jgi:endonuclease G, mitochondrial
MKRGRGRGRGGWGRGALVLAATVGLALGWLLLGHGPERREEVFRAARVVLESHKRVSPADFLGDVFSLYVLRTGQVPGAEIGEAGMPGGVPRPTGFAHGAVTVLENEGFAVGYAEALRAPVWATYRARDLAEEPPRRPRPEGFQVDRRTRARVAPEAYTRSGYDRGHLAPNFVIARQYGERAQQQTFLMSNVVPQRPSLNSGAWRELEERLAVNYPARFREVAVVCGPIFGADPPRLPSGVAIPKAFFMIVLDTVEGRTRAVAVRIDHDVDGDGRRERWRPVSIDRLEDETGLDFFAAFDDAVEVQLESRAALSLW